MLSSMLPQVVALPTMEVLVRMTLPYIIAISNLKKERPAIKKIIRDIDTNTPGVEKNVNAIGLPKKRG